MIIIRKMLASSFMMSWVGASSSSVQVSGFTGALEYFNSIYAPAEPHQGFPVYSTPPGPDGAHEDLHLFYVDGAWMLNDTWGAWHNGELNNIINVSTEEAIYSG